MLEWGRSAVGPPVYITFPECCLFYVSYFFMCLLLLITRRELLPSLHGLQGLLSDDQQWGTKTTVAYFTMSPLVTALQYCIVLHSYRKYSVSDSSVHLTSEFWLSLIKDPKGKSGQLRRESVSSWSEEPVRHLKQSSSNNWCHAAQQQHNNSSCSSSRTSSAVCQSSEQCVVVEDTMWAVGSPSNCGFSFLFQW